MACFTRMFKREKKSYDLSENNVKEDELTPQEFSVISLNLLLLLLLFSLFGIVSV